MIGSEVLARRGETGKSYEVGWFRTLPATNLGGTVSGACVPTPPGPPLARGGKVMAAAMDFSTGNGVQGVRP